AVLLRHHVDVERAGVGAERRRRLWRDGADRRHGGVDLGHERDVEPGPAARERDRRRDEERHQRSNEAEHLASVPCGEPTFTRPDRSSRRTSWERSARARAAALDDRSPCLTASSPPGGGGHERILLASRSATADRPWARLAGHGGRNRRMEPGAA